MGCPQAGSTSAVNQEGALQESKIPLSWILLLGDF